MHKQYQPTFRDSLKFLVGDCMVTPTSAFNHFVQDHLLLFQGKKVLELGVGEYSDPTLMSVCREYHAIGPHYDYSGGREVEEVPFSYSISGLDEYRFRNQVFIRGRIEHMNPGRGYDVIVNNGARITEEVQFKRILDLLNPRGTFLNVDSPSLWFLDDRVQDRDYFTAKREHWVELLPKGLFQGALFTVKRFDKED
jgi:hypothetical protein